MIPQSLLRGKLCAFVFYYLSLSEGGWAEDSRGHFFKVSLSHSQFEVNEKKNKIAYKLQSYSKGEISPLQRSSNLKSLACWNPKVNAPKD